VPSPAELIGDRLGERVSVKHFLNLIGRIRSYGRLKALSAFGVLAVTLVLGAVVGALYARITERRPADPGHPLGRLGLSRRGLAVLAAVVAAVVAVGRIVSIAVFWPLLASYYRGGAPGHRPPGQCRLAAVAYAVFAATLIGAYGLLTSRPAAGVAPSAAMPHVGRRAVLAGGPASGWPWRRAESSAALHPLDLRLRRPPEQRRPRRHHAQRPLLTGDPEPDRPPGAQGSWQLKIGGAGRPARPPV